jgi:hypothetical protein
MFLSKTNYNFYNLLTFLIYLGVIIPSPSLAENQISVTSVSGSLPRSWDFTPPNTGQPNHREGGATRSPLTKNTNCFLDSDDFIALVPPSGKGFTAQEYPTLFWYLPPHNAEKLTFTLKDNEGNEIYSQAYLPIKNQLTPQIMSLKLPANMGLAPLQIGQEYHWELALICNTSNDFDFISVQGVVERITPNFSSTNQELQKISLDNQVKIYAQNRLWYETIDTMLQLRKLEPISSDLESAWLNLLNSVGLENITNAN